MIANIREDWNANRGNLKGRLVLLLFRIAHAIRALPAPWWMFGIPLLGAYRLLVEWVLGVELRYKTRIGPGLRLFHAQGLVVHEESIIGAHCTLRQSTTIGNKTLRDGRASASPVLGCDVDVGANSVILGSVKIGDGCVIGAGAVVVKDVPARSVVAGNPARVIRFQKPDEQPLA